jgi:tRNA-2-methylthio-N6-dimethylallyladenosine synthase
MESVLRTIEKGIAEGYKKVFLIGTNTSHYGKDIGTDFFTLLDNVLKIQGDFKIIIHNFEPHGIEEAPERFLENVSAPKILSFYFPLNSGSQFVLNRMKRGYDIETVMSTLKRLRGKNRKVLIRSEFIVGYPGERWRHFRQTLSLIMRFPFSRIDLHMYSPRPKIHALELDGQVSLAVRYLRFIIIHGLVFLKVDLKKLRPI